MCSFPSHTYIFAYTIIHTSLLTPGCVQFSGSIGLHSYICTVEARPATGSSVNFTNTTVTPPGRELFHCYITLNVSNCLSIITAPICISERDVIHFIGQRNVTVCVNLGVLTDRFENYELEVREILPITNVVT